MKKIATILLLIISFKAKSQDYRIQINDTALDISLDTSYEIPVNGKMMKFSVSSHDTLKYDDDMFSFLYPKGFRVSKNPIDSGIEQISIITAEGNGILIQKYSTISPTALNELMLSELTKKNLNYGYALKRDDYTRTLKSGQSITVDKAIMTYKDDTYQYEVASVGKKDAGIIIVTFILSKDSPQGQKIVDLLWNSLIYK